MNKKQLKNLINYYPKSFRDNYGEQILDFYEQSNGEVNKKDIYISILIENSRRIAGTLALLIILPVTFFVITNTYYYSYAKIVPPQFVSALNNSVKSPIIVLGALGLATLLSIYASLKASLVMEKNTIKFNYLGLGSFTGLIVLISSGLSLVLIGLYLFAENIGFQQILIQ